MPSTHALASPMMRCLRVAFMLDSSALDGHQGNTGTYVPRPCPEGLLSKDDCNHDTSSNHSYTNESVCDDSARQRLFRSEEHTSELQSIMRITYAVFCLKK